MNVAQAAPYPRAPQQWQGVNQVLPSRAPTIIHRGTRNYLITSRKIISVIHAFIGSILIFCGVVVSFVQFPEIYHPHYDDHETADEIDGSAWGVWFGAWYMVTGVFGILSIRRHVLVILYMILTIIIFVMSIVATMTAGVILSYCVDMKNIATTACTPYTNQLYSYTQLPVDEKHAQCVEEFLTATRVHMTFYSLQVICCGMEVLVSITGAILICAGCCNCSMQPQQRQYNAYQQQYPAQIPLAHRVPPTPQFHQVSQTTESPTHWSTQQHEANFPRRLLPYAVTESPTHWSTQQHEVNFPRRLLPYAATPLPAVPGGSAYLEPDVNLENSTLYDYVGNGSHYEHDITQRSEGCEGGTITVIE